MPDAVQRTPFQPQPRDFTGHRMPPTVPAGTRLELSRSRIVPGQESGFEDWMRMLTTRYDEALAPLSAERSAFEATFQHTDAAGTSWIYHLTFAGEDGSGLDESNAIDADHAAYSRRVKEPGWEELIPHFMLAPAPVREVMQEWAQTGAVTAAGVDDSTRPLLAALANPTTREAFARIVLGEASDAPSRRDERALAQLAAAGLIVQSGDGWDVDAAHLRTLLQRGTRRRPNQGPERFLTSDGRIDRYPSQQGERHEFLRALAARVINTTETLKEAELGTRLAPLTDDTALLRRMLVDHGILHRDPSGAAYRLVAVAAGNEG